MRMGLLISRTIINRTILDKDFYELLYNGLARVDRNVSAFDVFAAFFMRLSVRKFACCRPVDGGGV